MSTVPSGRLHTASIIASLLQLPAFMNEVVSTLHICFPLHASVTYLFKSYMADIDVLHYTAGKCMYIYIETHAGAQTRTIVAVAQSLATEAKADGSMLATEVPSH